MEKRLFTPGPVSTTKTVKAAVTRDVGPCDADFLDPLRFIRSKLLEIAAADPDIYTTILLQGSGTFAVEAVFANVFGKKKDEKVSQNSKFTLIRLVLVVFLFSGSQMFFCTRPHAALKAEAE